MNAVTRRSTTLDHVEGFAAAAERFAVAVARTDLRAPVLGCPGWSVYELVVHLGNVHAWAATIVETGQPAVEQNDEPRSTSKPRTVSEWYAGKAEDLYEVLRQAPPDAPCWNFAFGAGVNAFWPRRQLHETTIHQLDLDLAVDRPTDIDPDVAVDGVDEVLTVLVHRMLKRGHHPVLEGPIALLATDTEDTWVVAPRPQPRHLAAPGTSAVPAQPLGPAGDVVHLAPSVMHRRAVRVGVPDRVEGTAEMLYRTLWHRTVAPDALRLGGEEGRVRAFLASRLTP